MPATLRIAAVLFGLASLVPAQIALQYVLETSAKTVPSAYGGLRNRELRREGIRMANRLRDLAAKGRLREIDALVSHRARPMNALEFLVEYDRQLKPQAIQLRDEILSRLPRSRRPDLPFSTLEFATTAQMIEQAADTLETVAKLLPDMWYREAEPKLPPPPARVFPTHVA